MMSHITKRTRKDSYRSNSHEPRLSTDAGSFDERMEEARDHQSQELTSEQLGRAQALANIKLNYQRPDEDLIKKMRKRNAALFNQAVKHFAPSTLPTSSTLLSSQINQFASNLPAPQLCPPNISSTMSQSLPSAQSLADRQSWEDIAKKSIIHKALSLDKVWDRKTWKQKASNIERLKLLKDDGYDIAPLQSIKGKRVSADAIITALLAHAKTRKVNNTDPASAVVAPITLLSPSAISDEVSEPTQEDSCGSHATPIIANREGEISNEKSRITAAALLSGIVPRKVPEVERMKMERRLWVTSPLVGIKRKHSHDDEYQPDWSELNPHKALHDFYNEAKTNRLIEPPCTCCMYDKVMRVLTRKETSKAFEEQAFDIFKRRIGRDIFRYARAARRVRHLQASTASSQYVATSKPSRIILQPPASPVHPASGLHACISANGMNLIIEELKHIAHGCNGDNNMYIKDPEEAEDRESDQLMEAGKTGNEQFLYQVRISTTPALQITVEGETTALIGLVKRLYESELTHCHRSQYDVDRMEMIADNRVPWRLSDATQSALEHLEKLLEAGQTLGGVEVRLGYVVSPEKARSR
jgi:hypothetical protein